MKDARTNYYEIPMEELPRGLQRCFWQEEQKILVAEPDAILTQALQIGSDEQLSGDALNTLQALLCELQTRYVSECLLLRYHVQEEERYLFWSGTRRVRALEFLDYMLADFGLAKGGANWAIGRVSNAILEVEMAQEEIANALEFCMERAVSYGSDTDVIAAEETEKNAVSDSSKNAPAMCAYVKKRIPWAYVRSDCVAEPGSRLRIRSLENPSGIEVVASDQTYIMIGCRGEVYDMAREKFERTYEPTQEPLDVLASMLTFFPEVETVDENRYITLDEWARLCYPRRDSQIYARRLNRRTKVFTRNGDYFLGLPGDYLAQRMDDPSDRYIIRSDIFEETYEAM